MRNAMSDVLSKVKLSPASITDALINHAIKITDPSREFMEKNSGKKLPDDYTKYPGKMDHSTALCFVVGSKSHSKR
jgi:hypothetical protein